MSDDNKKQVVFTTAPLSDMHLKDSGLEKNESNGLSYVIQQATGSAKRKAPRVAFTEDPNNNDNYAGIYKIKSGLLPDYMLKQVRVTNHLIASILRARGNTMSMFGHIKKDRFDVGTEIIIKPEFVNAIKNDQMEIIKRRMQRAEKLLVNCGHNDGLETSEKMSLSDFFYLQAQNGLTFGRFATEFVYKQMPTSKDQSEKFAYFRPADSGTIMPVAKKQDNSGAEIRRRSIALIKENISKLNLKIDMSRLEEDEYAWIQVINGIPYQAFTSKEMHVQNLYPSTDVEHKGYPVTPIDTAVQSVTTHISIDSYNKLYFQNGRAAKGMLVLKSDDIDSSVLDDVKSQFMASINSVNNAFRAPIFGVGSKDDVAWLPMVSNAGDGEFQFLYDQVARNILAAFNMSPDELPGYGHLSRGTNSQSLSESSNEHKLTASRDTGLRPLILQFQSFLNHVVLPIIDPELAQICSVQLAGLDAQNREQEALRLQSEMPIHMNYDEVLAQVDKDTVGAYLAGKFPMNERYQVIADKYLEVGALMNGFLQDPIAQFDPMNKYKRDAFWQQHMQTLLQLNPDAVKAHFAHKPYDFELMRLFIMDYLEEQGD